MVTPLPREIRPEAIPATASILEKDWGYPRTITDPEILEGYWIEDENGQGVIWLVDAPEGGAICLHGIGSPQARGWVFTPQVQEVARIVACLLGARRLYAPIPLESRALSRYLRMRGWRPAESFLGPYLELGGGG